MSATQSKQPVTIKSALALAGAAILYLVANALGIDLTGKDERPKRGAPTAGDPAAPETPRATARDDSGLIQQLFRTSKSDRIVEAEGVVVHVLPLDDDGARHQNFLLELSNGITLKIAHNIDLAPALPNLRKGATVRFHGEYEHNEKGGVVHWTHHDPAGRHEHGWLELEGQRYE